MIVRKGRFEKVPTAAIALQGDGDEAPVAASLLAGAKEQERRSARKAWAIRVAIVILGLAIWDSLTRVFGVDSLFVGTPYGMFSSLVNMFVSGEIWHHIWATAYASALGLLVGSVIGVVTAAILTWVPILDRATAPLFAILNSMPRPAIAPIVILWFGLDVGPKVFVAASLVVFITLISTQAGLKGITPDIEMLARTLRLNPMIEFWKIRLPAAIPSMVAGFRLSAVYSVLGVVVTEMIASRDGLGQLLVVETSLFRVDGAFAVIAILALITSLLDTLISIGQARINRRMGVR